MLENVKTALRLNGDTFDTEVNGLIAACLADLKLAGIDTKEQPPRIKRRETDPLIERAVILYCKAHFGYISGNERFISAYELQKHSLCLAGDYKPANPTQGG
jgi:hypothetical protein